MDGKNFSDKYPSDITIGQKSLPNPKSERFLYSRTTDGENNKHNDVHLFRNLKYSFNIFLDV
jgi:hypothetical protein